MVLAVAHPNPWSSASFYLPFTPTVILYLHDSHDRQGADDGKERKKTDSPREGWENGTPPPHRDFKERSVVR